MVYKRNPDSDTDFEDNYVNIRKLLTQKVKAKKGSEPVKDYYKPTGPEDKTLVFESRFECGNLNMVNKVSDKDYELML